MDAEAFGGLMVLVLPVVAFFLIKWKLKKNKLERIKNSLDAWLKLHQLVMMLDGEAEDLKIFYNEHYLPTISQYLYDLDFGYEYLGDNYCINEEGDRDFNWDFIGNNFQTSLNEIVASGDTDAESAPVLDKFYYPRFDSLTKSIIKKYREDTFRSLAKLCGSDLDLHEREIQGLDYLAKKLKIKNKKKKEIMDEVREEVEETIRKNEANAERIALWDEKIKTVNIPGWKKQTGDFMGHLYDKDIDAVLSISDKQLAKDVPGLTESKAKALKKLLTE